MASEDQNEVFITDIAVTTTERSQNLQNNDVPNAEDVNDNASAFTSQTVDSLLVGDIFDDPTVRPGNETALEATNKITQKLRKFAKFAPTNCSTSEQSRNSIAGRISSPHPPKYRGNAPCIIL